MAGRTGISLPSLHWFLWEHRNPETSTVEVTQSQLAKDLAVTRPRAGHAITGLVAQGRVAKTDRRSVYLVNDPAGFVDGS